MAPYTHVRCTRTRTRMLMPVQHMSRARSLSVDGRRWRGPTVRMTEGDEDGARGQSNEPIHYPVCTCCSTGWAQARSSGPMNSRLGLCCGQCVARHQCGLITLSPSLPFPPPPHNPPPTITHHPPTLASAVLVTSASSGSGLCQHLNVDNCGCGGREHYS